MSQPFKLSKSKLLSYRQCPKRLWLQTHRPDLAEVDDATVTVMAVGTQVGETFRTTYPAGRLVDSDDLTAALALTRELLATSPPAPIFEATLQARDVLVRIDLLEPVGSGYRLVEAKSSTRVKDYHLDDAAIQTWVARGAGIPIVETCIAHLDNRFVYPGDGQYAGLFVEESVDGAVAERQPLVGQWVQAAQAMLAGAEPSIAAGDQCHDPFTCPFLDYCRPAGAVEEFPVEILPRSPGLARGPAGRGLYRPARRSRIPPGPADPSTNAARQPFGPGRGRRPGPRVGAPAALPALLPGL